jgi:hypothetical protein
MSYPSWMFCLETGDFLPDPGRCPGMEIRPVPSTAMLDGYLLEAICHGALRPRRFQMAVLLAQSLTVCDWLQNQQLDSFFIF